MSKYPNGAPHTWADNPHCPKRLSTAQMKALELARKHQLIIVWLVDENRKPWYALTGGVLPATIQTLWLAGLLRQEKTSGRLAHDGSAGSLEADRAVVTESGRKMLAQALASLPWASTV